MGFIDKRRPHPYSSNSHRRYREWLQSPPYSWQWTASQLCPLVSCAHSWNTWLGSDFRIKTAEKKFRPNGDGVSSVHLAAAMVSALHSHLLKLGVNLCTPCRHWRPGSRFEDLRGSPAIGKKNAREASPKAIWTAHHRLKKWKWRNEGVCEGIYLYPPNTKN